MATTKEIVAALVKKGATTVESKIMGVTKSEDREGRPRLCVRLETPIKSYTSENGVDFIEGTTQFIWVYPSQAKAAYKESNPKLASVAGQLTRNDKAANIALEGATAKIVIEPVAGDEIYKNPFSTADGEGKCYGHDALIPHLVGIALTKENIKIAEETKRMILIGD